MSETPELPDAIAHSELHGEARIVVWTDVYIKGVRYNCTARYPATAEEIKWQLRQMIQASKDVAKAYNKLEPKPEPKPEPETQHVIVVNRAEAVAEAEETLPF